MLHRWKKNEDGEIDMYAMSCDYHNGPVCERCGTAVCENCKPEWESMECAAQPDEVDRLTDEIARLRVELDRERERETALMQFAIRASDDFTECDKMMIHVSQLKQDTGYNAYLIDAKQSGARWLAFDEYIRMEWRGKEDGK